MASENLVHWLRECYREDRSRAGVVNFYTSRCQHRYLMEGNEKLANEAMPEVLVSPEYAAKASAHAALYRREQEVVYATLFLCGKHEGKSHICPLVFYQGQFSNDNASAFSIDTTRWRLNPTALEMLEMDANYISEILQASSLSDATVGALRDELAERGVDTSALWQWPQLVGKEDLIEAGEGELLTLLPVSGIAILPLSVSSRGIIDELALLASQGSDEWSLPLQIFLGNQTQPPAREIKQDVIAVPALLSQAQEKIVHSARHHPVTLCHGPPGTGKSFTIAAVALDHVSRGESVLVASRMDHAVDVVEEKIDTMLSGDEITLRAGRKEYLKKLKHYLEACIAGQITANTPEEIQLRRLYSDIKKSYSSLLGDEHRMESEWRRALTRGELLAKPDPNVIDRIRRAWAKRKVKHRNLLMELSDYINSEYDQRESQLSFYLRMKRKVLLSAALHRTETRKQFQTLLKALRKHRGSEQEQVFRSMDFSPVFAALPVWLVKLDDLHRVVPLQKNLFDVAIIDESSQCDLASVLPVLQRAKRIVIAGDAKQLRHISFLATARQHHLAADYQVPEKQQETFNYRSVSVMDHATEVCQDHSQTGFLNEHFRSRPDIIRFSNKNFYQGALLVMRERPWETSQQAGKGSLPSAGLALAPCHGKRNNQGVNQEEVDELIKRLTNILTDLPEPAAKPLSIGILSPFRNQVEAIRATLEQRLDAPTVHRLIHTHDLLIGTAHSFQGEERDVMLISLSLDTGSKPSAVRFAEREDVFNVAITRARNHQIIFHSLDEKSLPRDSLLGSYLLDIGNASEVAHPPAAMDRFMKEVAAALAPHQIDVMPHQHVAGISVDLLLIDQKSGQANLPQAIGLDLIGYPGESYQAVPLRRANILRRADFRLYPLGYTEWKLHPQNAIDSIIELLRP
ncbi:MAG: DEAD/DEAH box helicase [Akkermansiaceae bacterium]